MLITHLLPRLTLLVSTTLLLSACSDTASFHANKGKITPAFGLTEGMDYEALRSNLNLLADPTLHGVYFTEALPQSSDAFTSYFLTVGPNSGLCMVAAMTDEISTPPTGILLRSHYQVFKNYLTSQYGQPKNTDEIMPGTPLEAPINWMMALSEQKRQYSALWTKQNNTLPPTINAIRLDVSAQDPTEGVIKVIYQFDNAQECSLELQRSYE